MGVVLRESRAEKWFFSKKHWNLGHLMHYSINMGTSQRRRRTDCSFRLHAGRQGRGSRHHHLDSGAVWSGPRGCSRERELLSFPVNFGGVARRRWHLQGHTCACTRYWRQRNFLGLARHSDILRKLCEALTGSPLLVWWESPFPKPLNKRTAFLSFCETFETDLFGLSAPMYNSEQKDLAVNF